MNVSGVIDRVKRQFGDESGVQILDADIFNWVNDAQIEICSQNEILLQKTSLVNIVSGTQEYSLPVDLLNLVTVSILQSGTTSYQQIKFLSLQDFNELIDGWDGTSFTGTPYAYTVFEDEVKLFPVPDSSVTDGIKFSYNRAPATVATSGDNLDLPLKYHNAIVNYCLQMAYELDANFEAAAAKQAQMGMQVASNRHNDGKKSNEFYHSITSLEEDIY